MHKLVTDAKVIPGQEVALQHQLLVCDTRIDVPPKSKRKFTLCLKVWKLKNPQTSNHFQEVFNLHVTASAGVADAATEDIWNNSKTGLLKTTEEMCGTTWPHRWHLETCGISTWKRPLLPSGKLSRPGRLVKVLGQHSTMLIKKPTRRSTRILTPSLQKSVALLTSLEKSGDKPVNNDAGEILMSEDSNQKVWLEHYQRLLNVEFDWDPDHLSEEPPVVDPPILITTDMVKKAIS